MKKILIISMTIVAIGNALILIGTEHLSVGIVGILLNNALIGWLSAGYQ